MLRLSRLTDYGIVVLAQMARLSDGSATSGRLARICGLPAPTVSKVLKTLVRRGVLTSTRGVKGGYTFARPPHEISIADVVGAIEGSIAMTECCDDRDCIVSDCSLPPHWQIINSAIQTALGAVTIADMAAAPSDLVVLQPHPENHQ